MRFVTVFFQEVERNEKVCGKAICFLLNGVYFNAKWTTVKDCVFIGVPMQVFLMHQPMAELVRNRKSAAVAGVEFIDVHDTVLKLNVTHYVPMFVSKKRFTDFEAVVPGNVVYDNGGFLDKVFTQDPLGLSLSFLEVSVPGLGHGYNPHINYTLLTELIKI